MTPRIKLQLMLCFARIDCRIVEIETPILLTVTHQCVLHHSWPVTVLPGMAASVPACPGIPACFSRTRNAPPCQRFGLIENSVLTMCKLCSLQSHRHLYGANLYRKANSNNSSNYSIKTCITTLSPACLSSNHQAARH